MDNKNGIVTIEGVNALGTREDVQALGKRIKAMVPGGSRLQDTEAMALAQISYTTGMNPFIGEIWYIPGKGPMVGIRGARRVADEAILREGGAGAYYFIEFVYVSAKDAGALENEDVLHAYKAVLHDAVSTKSYLTMLSDTTKMLKEAGVEDAYGEAKKMVGPKPEWIGFGYATKSEKTSMNKNRVAMKRAEAMALQQRFSVPFGAQMAAADTYDDSDYGKAPLVPVRTSAEMDKDFSDEVDSAFPKEDIIEGEVQSTNDRPYPADILKEKMRTRVENLGGSPVASKGQRGVMVGKYNEILGGDENRYEVCGYLFGRRKSSALSHKQIIVALNHLNQDEEMARLELNAAYKKSQIDKGQQELV